jgi:hypothetical protein
MFDKYQKITHRVVDYSDLEDFINEHYKSDYEIVAANEWNNDTSYSINVEKEEFTEYEEEKLRDFNFCTIRIILLDLCNKGLIEEGDYLIKVSW